jgi:hypothetical protein
VTYAIANGTCSIFIGVGDTNAASTGGQVGER